MDIGSTPIVSQGPSSGTKALLGVLASFALLVPALAGVGGLATGGGGDAARRSASSRSVHLPLTFEPNRGQTHASVDFLARSAEGALFLTGTEAVMAFQRDGGGRDVVRMRLVGSSPDAEPRGLARLAGTVNHLSGGDASRWRTGLPTFGRVAYEGVYPGVDVVYRGAGAALRYDFVVAPGADPSTIALRFDGARDVSIAPNGDLLVRTGAGTLRQSAPRLFQWVDGTRRAVAGAFALAGSGEVGFDVGAYDASRPLVIDPTVSYGTYLGGSGFDITFGVAVDASGHAYVAGHTASTSFPTQGPVTCPDPAPPSSLQCNPDGTGHDAFVAKLNPAGTALVYSTYLGGGGFDQAWDVAVDSGGNAYLVGATNSFDDPATAGVNEAFPTTANAFDRFCGTDGLCDRVLDEPFSDVFMAKLNSAGTALRYSTYIGGSDYDQQVQVTALPSEMAIAVRGSTAYVVGATASDDFPTTWSTYDSTCGLASVPACDDGARDAFLTVIDTARNGLGSVQFSTYLGGSGDDEAKGVGVDNAGNAYVAGTTWGFEDPEDEDDTINNFPTKNAFRSSYGGGESDAYVLKVSPSGSGGSALRYSTYLGGGGKDAAWDVAVLSPTRAGRRHLGSAFVVGFTDSGDDPATPAPDGIRPYFPTTRGAFDRTYNGQHTEADFSNQFLNGDAYVTRVLPSGSELGYSTLLGSEFHDVAGGVAVDRRGHAYVTGYTTCENQTPDDPPNDGPCTNAFPVRNPPPDMGVMNGSFTGSAGLHNIPTDSFATKVRPDGTGLVYSAYLPGNHFDRGFGVAVRDRNASGDSITPQAFYVGRTNSTGGLPISADAVQTGHAGGSRDGYVIKVRG